jgi:hypothetical protein
VKPTMTSVVPEFALEDVSQLLGAVSRSYSRIGATTVLVPLAIEFDLSAKPVRLVRTEAVEISGDRAPQGHG